MVFHNVYFWLKSELSKKEKDDFNKFFDMLHTIPAIEEFNVGIPAETLDREVTENAFTYSLHISFKNVADHNNYQNHDDHIKAVEAYSRYWDRILVHDSEV